MKVLVTGAKGQLGFDIIKELTKRDYLDIYGIDIDDLDITDEAAVFKLVECYHPDVIMHNAAYTAVDKAEENVELCTKVNAFGTKYLVETAKKIKAKFVYISTDYVFDGEKDGFYEVEDIKNPISIYGETKAMGEDFIVDTYDKYFIVRISWVFGMNGKNFIKTMLNLSKIKKEINVVADQYGSPTYTFDLSKLLCDMIETEKYGIYHVTNEETCSWYEFACEIFKQANIDISVNPITTDRYPTLAKRPKNSKMSKEKLATSGFSLLPNWKDALTRYLKELNIK